jgi:hypothetical protein
LATALLNVPVIVKWVEQKLLAAGGKAHNVENMRLFLEGAVSARGSAPGTPQ